MRRKILLADDSVTIQKVVELTLPEELFEVFAVSNGDEALARFEAEPPDLVIADVHMPGATGYEVARRVKSASPGTPVILLVGTFESFDEAEARATGAEDSLKKPFDSEELLQTVQRLLGPPAAPAVAESPAAAESPWSLPPNGGSSSPQPWAPEPAPPPRPAGGWGEEPFDLSSLGPAAFEAPDESEVFRLSQVAQPSVPEPLPEAPRGSAEADEFIAEVEDLVDEELLLVDETPYSDVVADAAEEAEPFRLGDDAEAVAEAIEETAAEPPFVRSGPTISAVEAIDRATEPSPAPPAAETVPGVAGGGPLSEQDIDRIARRVAQLLGDRVLREVAWEVVPDLAEVVIKDRLRELESQVG